MSAPSRSLTIRRALSAKFETCIMGTGRRDPLVMIRPYPSLGDPVPALTKMPLARIEDTFGIDVDHGAEIAGSISFRVAAATEWPALAKRAWIRCQIAMISACTRRVMLALPRACAGSARVSAGRIEDTRSCQRHTLNSETPQTKPTDRPRLDRLEGDLN